MRTVLVFPTLILVWKDDNIRYVKFKTCVFCTLTIGHFAHLKIIVIIVIIEHHTVLVLLTEVPGQCRQDTQHKQQDRNRFL